VICGGGDARDYNHAPVPKRLSNAHARMSTPPLSLLRISVGRKPGRVARVWRYRRCKMTDRVRANATSGFCCFAKAPSPCPRRRSRLNTDNESVPTALVNQSGKTDQSVAPAKKKAVGASPKAAHAAKAKKTLRLGAGDSFQ
jgi:hypothetical protein